ncbi:hypothetical protein IWQ61_008569 [Dispira simplex]|nr:hypothetical protein IWQ61_008569 [Dispira simplex]
MYGTSPSQAIFDSHVSLAAHQANVPDNSVVPRGIRPGYDNSVPCGNCNKPIPGHIRGSGLCNTCSVIRSTDHMAMVPQGHSPPFGHSLPGGMASGPYRHTMPLPHTSMDDLALVNAHHSVANLSRAHSLRDGGLGRNMARMSMVQRSHYPPPPPPPPPRMMQSTATLAQPLVTVPTLPMGHAYPYANSSHSSCVRATLNRLPEPVLEYCPKMGIPHYKGEHPSRVAGFVDSVSGKVKKFVGMLSQDYYLVDEGTAEAAKGKRRAAAGTEIRNAEREHQRLLRNQARHEVAVEQERRRNSRLTERAIVHNYRDSSASSATLSGRYL